MSERPFPVARLENYALQFLKHGREGWDIPHSKAVAYHAAQIARSEGLDVRAHYTAGWLHDAGYYKVFNLPHESHDLGKITDKKTQHMIKGVEYAEIFFQLKSMTEFYTPAQQELVKLLIGTHDKLDELTTIDQIAFMEADTLGMIDLSRIKPTFDRATALKNIEGELMKRASLFRTKYGKQTLTELFPMYLEYCNNVLK